MATLHKEADVIDRILTECDDDYVGLWSIYRQVKEAGVTDPKAYTMALLRFLLFTGAVKAGAPDADGGFEPWSLNPGDAFQRILEEWSRLTGEPDIGDVVWFTTPTAGS